MGLCQASSVVVAAVVAAQQPSGGGCHGCFFGFGCSLFDGFVMAVMGEGVTATHQRFWMSRTRAGCSALKRQNKLLYCFYVRYLQDMVVAPGCL